MKISDIIRYIFLIYSAACLVFINFIGVEDSASLMPLMKTFILISLIDFVYALGSYVCFFELFVLMGAIQWFGSNIWLSENFPKLAFRPATHYYTTMFSYTLMLTLCLLFFKPSRLKELTRQLISRLDNLPDIDKYAKFFFYSGFVFSFLSSFVSGVATIGQLLYLFSQLGYVSIICFIFSKSPQRNVYITITFAYTLLISIRSTLFWPIIFWSIFFFIIYAVRRRVSLPSKLVILTVGASLVIFIQSFKQQLRFETAYRPDYLEQRSGSFTAFSDLAEQRLDALRRGNDIKRVFLGTFFFRMNQGVWDNMVITRVDQSNNFLNGESIFNAALGAFIPRVLWPDKPKFDNSLLGRLLGRKVQAFISISIPAEAYVNFAFGGGLLFMAIYAILLRLFYNMVMRWSFKKSALYFVFFPFLFYNFMRAEVDFVQTIYSIVSSSVAVLLIFYVMRRMGLLSGSQKQTATLALR